ncbi:phage GP46 family protein [Acinetobacter junii]|jgi:phage gp46-like protein|uniref:Phage GP46 family protein n=1 Tax=Acinetobacter junii TaxID=40215 RepID=A0AAW5RAN7_ACIJU|nr:phage GP46 family protein [Acinetobacter junii]MCU4395973.1 phage GP46 family protein [Acinetobacter junii]
MGTINLETKDYVLTSLDAAFNDDVVQVVCQRLNIHRGRYWADPNLGSRFYTLKRSKDVPRMLQIVKQYAEEALTDLVPNRLQDLVVSSTQTIKSRIDLKIEITRLTGEKQTIPYFVAVGG